MRVEEKTKGQLINELSEMRSRIAELEASEIKYKWVKNASQDSELPYLILMETTGMRSITTQAITTITYIMRMVL